MTNGGNGRRVATLALVAVLAVLAACDGGATSTTARAMATSRPTGTATATAAPTVLYQADWSTGANGWTLPSGWSVQNGALLNDGSGTTAIPIPYAVTDADYEIDFDAQEISATQPQDFGNLFGVVAKSPSGEQLYEVQILFIGNHTRAPAEWELTANGGSQGNYAAADYTLNNAVKTYRVLVHGRGMRLAINSPTSVAGVEGIDALSPASLLLECQHIQLSITRLTVLKLAPVA